MNSWRPGEVRGAGRLAACVPGPAPPVRAPPAGSREACGA
jgi:hypothetical protein